MQMPLISVIIPVYKVEEYLDACVDSIVNQTYRNLEIILVDDGSPDRCPQMCDEWKKKDSRIKVLHKKNGGASSARNAGLDVATGEYIGFVDSDDYIAANMYEVMHAALCSSGKKVASCASTFVCADGEMLTGVGLSAEMTLNKCEAINGMLEARIGVAVWCKLFARDVLENLRFPEGEINEEIPLIIPMMENAEGIIHTGSPLYYYRGREGSVTDTYWRRDVNIILKNLEKLRKQIDDAGLGDCQKSYGLFAAQSAYGVSIQLEKAYDKIDCATKIKLKDYLRLMRKYLWIYMINGSVKLKDKVLYLLVATRLLRPVYKLFGKL